MGYIYKITNQINNKCYIGQTTRNVEIRWNEHIRKANTLKQNETYAIHYALAKYGIQNFTFKIIDQCPNELLDEKETYWIKFYNSFYDGYNLTKGGKTTKNTHYQNHDNLIIQLYQNECFTCRQIADKLSMNKNYIGRILTKYNIPHNENLNKNMKEFQKYGNSFNKKIVQCINLNDNTIIQEFESIRAAARWLILNNYTKNKSEKSVSSPISRVCSGKLNKAYGFKWQFK